MNCKDNPQFYALFKANMEALGVPPPVGLYLNAVVINKTINDLSSLIVKYGKNVTLKEVLIALPPAIGSSSPTAILLQEASIVFGSMLVTTYVGFCIGSLIVATYKYGKCHFIPQVVYRQKYLEITKATQLPSWILELNFNNYAQGSVA